MRYAMRYRFGKTPRDGNCPIIRSISRAADLTIVLSFKSSELRSHLLLTVDFPFKRNLFYIPKHG